LQSLYPKARSDKGKSRALDEETCFALINLRREMPSATVAHLIATMNERKLVTAGINFTLQGPKTELKHRIIIRVQVVIDKPDQSLSKRG
jgi:hypothetical protein